MDRMTFRQIEQIPGPYQARTSGSTGVAVVIQKYEQQKINQQRNRQFLNTWHGWDFLAKTQIVNGLRPYQPSKCTQLASYPQLFPKDLSQYNKIISFGEAWIGIGIDVYSSEEFGTIAIQCPYNKLVLHIMPNLEISCTTEGMRITDIDHPYLKDYEIGDYAEHVVCGCGINLPAITHVKGRIRNMIKMPDGTRKWPIYGLYNFPSIERFQVFQETLTKLRVHISGTIPEEAVTVMRNKLGYNFEIEIVQGNFKTGKFEEFICEVN